MREQVIATFTIDVLADEKDALRPEFCHEIATELVEEAVSNLRTQLETRVDPPLSARSRRVDRTGEKRH